MKTVGSTVHQRCRSSLSDVAVTDVKSVSRCSGKKPALKPRKLEHRHMLPYFVLIRHFSVAKPGFYTHRLLCGHFFNVHIGVWTETDIESFLHSLQGSTSLKQFYQFIFSPIPLAPICLNSVHFNCWPHEDESKRIPFFTVAQNHAAALYWIKSLDIKHITDWRGKKKHIIHALPSLLWSFFSVPVSMD